MAEEDKEKTSLKRARKNTPTASTPHEEGTSDREKKARSHSTPIPQSASIATLMPAPRDHKPLARKITIEVDRLCDEKQNLKVRVERFVSFIEKFGVITIEPLRYHPIWKELLSLHSADKSITPFKQERVKHLSPLNQLLGMYYNALGMIHDNKGRLEDALVCYQKGMARGSILATRNKFDLLNEMLLTETQLTKNRQGIKNIFNKLLGELEILANTGSLAAALLILEVTYVLQQKIIDRDFIVDSTLYRSTYYVNYSFQLLEQIEKEDRSSISPTSFRTELENLYYGKGLFDPKKNGTEVEAEDDIETDSTLIFQVVPDKKAGGSLVGILNQYKHFFENQYTSAFPRMPVALIQYKAKQEAVKITGKIKEHSFSSSTTKPYSELIEEVLKRPSVDIGKLTDEYEAWKTEIDTPIPDHSTKSRSLS